MVYVMTYYSATRKSMATDNVFAYFCLAIDPISVVGLCYLVSDQNAYWIDGETEVCEYIISDHTFTRCAVRILYLQKRAARILLNADFSTPSVFLFSKLKWIPVFDLIKLRKILLLFNILLNPNAPSCFKTKFKFL